MQQIEKSKNRREGDGGRGEREKRERELKCLSTGIGQISYKLHLYCTVNNGQGDSLCTAIERSPKHI